MCAAILGENVAARLVFDDDFQAMAEQPELYRDRVDVSLDGKQIFFLFFGGSLVLCMVFVVGVAVGRKMESRSHVGVAGTAMERDPLAALDRFEQGRGMAFRQSLGEGQHAAGGIEAEVQALETARADVVASAKAAAATKSEGTAASQPAQPVQAATAELAKAKSTEDSKPVAGSAKSEDATKPNAATPVSPAKPNGKPAPSEVVSTPPVAAKASDKSVAVEPGKAAAATPAAKPADKKDAKMRFTLQLSSFQKRAEAEAFAQTISAQGFETRIHEAVVEGKGTFYRVRSGAFPSFEAAEGAKAKFEKKTNKIALVSRM